MSCWVSIVDACSGDMSCGYVWCVWSHLVQQLWVVTAAWLLLLPWLCLEQWSVMSRWHLQPWCRGSVQQLQRRLRVPFGVQLIDPCCSAVSCWSLQCTRGDNVHQLQRRLRLPRCVQLVHSR